jgi:hypothetical protein
MTTTMTPYGPVHHGGACDDSYPNIETYEQQPIKRFDPPTVKLQGPAIKALRAAERAYAKRTRPWMRKRTIPTTGSWRSCAFQTAQYASDSQRFAHPDTTLHTRGLAIDVDTRYLNETVKKVLRRHGWTQARPVDEPWHFSMGAPTA